MTKVAVIIPHYNDATRLERCLAALMPQAQDDVEIVVADNNSTVSLDGLKSAFPKVRFVTQMQAGAGPARNKGVEETTAPWLMFLDADCLPAPDWIAVGRKIAKDGHVIGGRIDVFSETEGDMSGAEAFEAVFAFHNKDYLERDDFMVTASIVTSRAVFDTVGGFRDDVSEDKEWCHRARAAGFTLSYNADFAVSHPARQDWAQLDRKWRRVTNESFLMHRLQPGSRLAWAMRGAMMVPSILAHTPKVWAAKNLNVGEKWRGFTTLVRLRLARMVWMIRQSITGRADA